MLDCISKLFFCQVYIQGSSIKHASSGHIYASQVRERDATLLRAARVGEKNEKDWVETTFVLSVLKTRLFIFYF